MTENLNNLRQNVVKRRFVAEFYNGNGCLDQRFYMAESLAAAEILAKADAKRENLALHDVREETG